MCAFLHQDPWSNHYGPQQGIAILPIGGGFVIQLEHCSCRHPFLHRDQVVAGNVSGDIHQIEMAAHMNESAFGEKNLQLRPRYLSSFGIELGALQVELVGHGK